MRTFILADRTRGYRFLALAGLGLGLSGGCLDPNAFDPNADGSLPPADGAQGVDAGAATVSDAGPSPADVNRADAGMVGADSRPLPTPPDGPLPDVGAPDRPSDRPPAPPPPPDAAPPDLPPRDTAPPPPPPPMSVPEVITVPQALAPADLPAGTKLDCFAGPDTFDLADCPVLRWGAYSYWAFSYIDNDFAMHVTAYDRLGRIAKEVRVDGARYIWKMEIVEVSGTVVLRGQADRTAAVSLATLRIDQN
jgi:hypothetical protein